MAQLKSTSVAGSLSVTGDITGDKIRFGGTKTVTANTTALLSDRIFANSAGGSFTITMPSSPTLGDMVTILDPNDSWFANAVTVNGNGKTIQGDATLILDENGIKVELIYNGTEWRVYA